MIVIGLDESGTGAWSGPATVCAYALDTQKEQELRKLGVGDSKKLTDKKRRGMVLQLDAYALATYVSLMTVEAIRSLGHRQAWVQAVEEALWGVHERLGALDLTPDRIIIDGNPVRIRSPIPAQFETHADSRFLCVSAASVIAKTVRNDLMIDLDYKYPEYLWCRNFGYGTSDHAKAIELHGMTPEHRPIKRRK